MSSQLLFADSLTSTLLEWLGLVNNSSSGIPEDHRSPRAYPTTLSLDTVEDVMVGEVDELEEDVG